MNWKILNNSQVFATILFSVIPIPKKYEVLSSCTFVALNVGSTLVDAEFQILFEQFIIVPIVSDKIDIWEF